MNILKQIQDEISESTSFKSDIMTVTDSYLRLCLFDNVHNELGIINDNGLLKLEIDNFESDNMTKVGELKRVIEIFQFHNRKNAFK